jgi:type IV pilus assembly protein PilA
MRRNERGFSLIELLIVVIIIMIIAAIAIPSLLRARISANESSVIGDTRTVVSAAHAYGSANAGLYDSNLTCLNTPNACIPGYPAPPVGPTFLDPNMASLQFKSGYGRSYQSSTGPLVVPPQASPSSQVAFVYAGTPAQVGRTGVRGFAGDSSGVLCTNQNGGWPGVTGDIQLAPATGTCEVLQ